MRKDEKKGKPKQDERSLQVLKRSNRFVVITIVIAYILLSIISVYAVSVVDRNNVVRQIDLNVNAITSFLRQDIETGERVEAEFLEEYRSKARIVSMMLPELPSLEENETTLEELRVALDAETISVFWADGTLIASTATYSENVTVEEAFSEHLGSRNYSDARIKEEESGSSYVIAAAVPSDGTYLVQAAFSSAALVSLRESTSIVSAAKNFPLYTKGETLLINKEDLRICSATNREQIGQVCDIPAEQFHRNKGKFDMEMDGERVMVRYHKYENYIIAAIVTYDDIFSTSYTVLRWMISGSAVILVVTLLAMRMGAILYATKRSKNK